MSATTVPRETHQAQAEVARLFLHRKVEHMAETTTRELPETLPGWGWYHFGCTTHATRNFFLGMHGPAVWGHVKLAYGGQHWVWSVSADQDGERCYDVHGRGTFKSCMIACNKAAFAILREVD